MLSFFSVGAKQGILFKDGRVLDKISAIDTIVFDETGTLTTDEFDVDAIFIADAVEADVLLAWVAAAEQKQQHPIARALLHEAERRGVVQPILLDQEYVPGRGVVATIDGRMVHVGSREFLRLRNVDLSPWTVDQGMLDAIDRSAESGATLVFVAVDFVLVGAIELRPILRPEVPFVISGLQRLGIRRLYILSGDAEASTRHLSEQLGMTGYFAGCLPDQKANVVKALQEEGATACFVGDGLNDAIAMKQAYVSVSVSGATTLATDTAQLVLLDISLESLCRAIVIGRNFDQASRRSFVSTLVSQARSASAEFSFGIYPSVHLRSLNIVAF